MYEAGSRHRLNRVQLTGSHSKMNNSESLKRICNIVLAQLVELCI